jgi:hypothetical protein
VTPSGRDTDDRPKIVDYLRDQLIGPLHGEAETVDEPPHRQYLTGILFPEEAETEVQLDEDIVDEGAGESGEESTEDPIALSTQQLPSAVGLSFVLPAWTAFSVELRAGRYEKDGPSWRRVPIDLTGSKAIELRPPGESGRAAPVVLLSGRASLESRWRRLGEGALVTVALVNRRHIPVDGRMDPGDCLLQVSMRCVSAHGFTPYPTPVRIQSGEEEAELALQYKDVPTYAVGHGCAADWEPDLTRPGWIETTYLPGHTVRGVAFTVEADEHRQKQLNEVLNLEYLATADTLSADVIASLDEFVDGYDEWALAQEREATTLPTRHAGAAERLVGRVDVARRRMRRGVRRLERDEVVREAFALANRAMLMQMVRSGDQFAGRRRTWNEGNIPEAVYTGTGRAWRPFQLAFLLLTVESAVDESADDRDLIDLIWFPTGGGKTEAYLGLMALVVLHRRLTLRDDGAGTTVITRYTLRLLTSQQFQRAATLICALESVRRARPESLGTSRISIGVWLGSNNSPNTYTDAVELVEKIKNDEFTSTSFQVETCPWCGTEMIPRGPAPQEAWGVSAANDSFRMNCPWIECEFHNELPASAVDADLYDRPPTCLIGTVDKFARLAWEPKAGVFLGSGPTPGPSLIIQDEFHLISGPLGTIVGLYEAAFDVVMASHNARPKVVASTATIRRAESQGAGVFGRPTALFPPAGISADNSYFVRYDDTSPGRRYVGLMPQGHTPLTAMVQLSAALLQSAEELDLAPPSDDAYWTLVAYHNSLRELGKSITLAHDDIPARMQVIASTEDGVRRLGDDDILELTGNVSPVEIPRSIEKLKKKKGEKDGISFVASTNMLSVGVDVPRLGLMLVVGQPKTTSEYIQASSRVGRSTPGLVVTLYSPSKPRDRSHYESFIPYHSALYRYVEPTSVTPFSVPARARGLHAGLVVLARHALGLTENTQAADFDGADHALTDLVEEFLRRVTVADSAERDNVERHLQELEADWQQLAEQALPTGGLRYAGGGKQHVALLRRFNQPGPGWPTLDSMRSVDTEVRMRVRGEDG